MEGFYIYKYVSKDGRVVYIGKSINVLQRVKQHEAEEKFSQYKDAEIYLHRCPSKHEMDALEVILIEKHKPELNVTAKTENELSFDASVEWVKLSDLLAEESKTAAVKSIQVKGKSGEKIIRSQKGADAFIVNVMEWHVLFYFINWLMEQQDDDITATKEFSINDREEASKWIWECDPETGEPHDVSLVSLRHNSGAIWMTTGLHREADRIWIDFYKPINVLKKAIPLMMVDLRNRKEEIKSYSRIDKAFIEKSKETGFYEFFKKVCLETSFPDFQVKLDKWRDNAILEELDNDDIPVKHTSPKMDFSELSLYDVLSNIGKPRLIRYKPGGAYWNILGVGGDHMIEQK